MLKLLINAWRTLRGKSATGDFRTSDEYWNSRYQAGGHSGCGSYNHLASFKAEVINNFVATRKIETVIEFGCGDGNQLALADYPSYVGYDVSAVAVQLCRDRFSGDSKKRFDLMAAYDGHKADLSLSLDVIFHLVEDHVFNDYMKHLFDSSTQHVVIYSSNTNMNYDEQPKHVRHRQFTVWIDTNRPAWKLRKVIPNRYSYNGDYSTTSFSDFFFFALTDGTDVPAP
jgi:SAM-dependent methyltransferase